MSSDIDGPLESFLSAIQAAGITPPAGIVADGKVHRWAGNPAKPKRKNSFYVLTTDPQAHGAFGDWGLSLSINWTQGRAAQRRHDPR